ncbi:LCP family protein [Nocardioides sp. HDW12B]|uniref:LCP family protein n=1 Tax=Nocardioides sp. HDW12B TaxID=2714939 RepID=UPI001407C07E|nr:LCP family protein [Nocardioides sp. HDW12B]QIK65557.1 LCP family protein [Nocardioides sp. HDW12B]
MAPVTSGSTRTRSTASHPGHPDLAAYRARELGRVRFRRALTLLVMTLLMPGSAQLVMGRKQVGRLAVRVWLACVGSALLLAAVGWLWPEVLFRLAADTTVLAVLRTGLTVLAIGWTLLLIDAWRLGDPLRLRQKQRLAMVGLNGTVVFAVAGSLLFASHLVAVQRDFITTMFGDGVASAAEHGRYNVLLIGGDAGDGRWGLRTDSMTVASIDEETGRTILFGLPRNMTNFPFPEGSELAAEFPDGYDCETCTLNSLATWAADHRDLFKGSETPGIDATIEGIEGITGLKINYYTLVNMEGFKSLVTAMGGLTLNVRDRIPIGVPVVDYIEPGVRRLNGFQTLWFARSRESADDYSRMARQKCVMSAMLQQLSPQTVLTKFEALADASTHLIETDLPASEVGEFTQLALRAKSQKVGTVSFVPPAINTSDPDIDKIRTMIDDAITKSEQPSGSGRKKGPGFSKSSSGASTGGSIGSLSSGYAANQSADLSKVC